MMRAVFDCVILLQAAARRTGPAAECLQAVRDGRLQLCSPPDFLAEVSSFFELRPTWRCPLLISPDQCGVPGTDAFRAGATPEAIVQSYSTLKLADVHAVVGRYLADPAPFEHT